MSSIPESIMRHRRPGTEIKKVGGKYYMQRITCKWIPETRQRKKVVTEYLGQVTENGLQPKRHRLASAVPAYSKEYGSTWLLRRLSGDILELLRKHFADEGDWIYACAMLRCIRACAMTYVEHFYEVSYLSEALPGLHLSSQNISSLMAGLGYRRKAMVDFMREFIPADNWYAIFDGTSVVCNSQHIHDAQRGYNSHGCHDPQLNLMYAIALQESRLCPVFYKQYPGSVRDVSAFMNMLREMGLKGALVITDKGFVKLSHLDELEGPGSASLGHPLMNTTFSGLMSLCTRPALCSTSRPSSSLWHIGSIVSAGRRPLLRLRRRASVSGWYSSGFSDALSAASMT